MRRNTKAPTEKLKNEVAMCVYESILKDLDLGVDRDYSVEVAPVQGRSGYWKGLLRKRTIYENAEKVG